MAIESVEALRELPDDTALVIRHRDGTEPSRWVKVPDGVRSEEQGVVIEFDAFLGTVREGMLLTPNEVPFTVGQMFDEYPYRYVIIEQHGEDVDMVRAYRGGNPTFVRLSAETMRRSAVVPVTDPQTPIEQGWVALGQQYWTQHRSMVALQQQRDLAMERARTATTAVMDDDLRDLLIRHAREESMIYETRHLLDDRQIEWRESETVAVRINASGTYCLSRDTVATLIGTTEHVVDSYDLDLDWSDDFTVRVPYEVVGCGCDELTRDHILEAGLTNFPTNPGDWSFSVAGCDGTSCING